MNVRSRVLAAAAVLALTSGMAVAGAVTAHATTLTCTQTKALYVAPYGCGGLQFPLSAGPLDLTADGNWWNAPVRGVTDATSNTHQDWYVFAVNGQTSGGEGDLGEYVAMYAPNGVIPGGITGVTVNNSPLDFCLSVQDIWRTVRGHHVIRWVTVLRNCFAGGGDGSPAFTLGTAPDGVNTVTSANPYQTWAPVFAQTDESLVNEALLSAGLRHWVGGNARYVLDDTAFGPSGTQLIAYPSNGGNNQVVEILGCTPPVTLVSGLAQVCP